jgi:hypothetical protein
MRGLPEHRPSTGRKALLVAIAAIASLILYSLLRQRDGNDAGIQDSPFQPTASIDVTAPALGPAEAKLSSSTPREPALDANSALARTEVQRKTSEQRARDWMAATAYPNSDGAIDHIHQVLQTNLQDPPVDASGQPRPDPFARSLPSATELAADRNVNPMDRNLGPEELAQLSSMVADYSYRLREQARDAFLEEQMAIVNAVQSGRFREVPNGKWPEGLNNTLVKEAQSTLGKDFNITTLPGRDPSHRRVLWLDRTHNPDYWSAAEELRYTQAEFAVAARTFFLQRRR